MPPITHDGSPAVSVEREGPVLIVTIRNPPVNALSTEVRRGLIDAVEAAQSDNDCKTILLMGEGANFIGGADIREFGKPLQSPFLPDVCLNIESSRKPVVAAIQGVALGGGLEIAVAAHYRFCALGARLGLPEVTLGILPGSGGTQRVTRLIGVKAALDLALTGRHATADEALAWGLVDAIVPAVDFRDQAIDYAKSLAISNAPVRPTREVNAGIKDVAAHRATIVDARLKAEKKYAGLFSPFKIIDAVEAALDLPFDKAIAVERAAFLAAMESPQRAGLIHAFFAEREVTKVPESRMGKARPLNAIGVIGGGTMGAGIAAALLDSGLCVTMIERDDAALDRGRAIIEKIYDGLIAKDRMDLETKHRRLLQLTGSTSYDDLANVDLVIEAVFEDMAIKQQVFTQLDRVCRADAVLATNTSYLDIDKIASATSRPREILGLHFFSPAHIMKLLEIVVPEGVEADVVATGFALAKRLRKVPVRAGVCDGFIGNRILSAYRLAAEYMIADGASPYQVDTAMRDFGFAMGPFQVYDLAGGDIAWANRQRKAATRDPQQRYISIGDRLCEKGWFGQKVGRGWYQYPVGSRQGTPDPEVEAIVAEERSFNGITPRAFGDEEIVRRVIAAIVNEGCKVLQERIALRPLDVDVVFLLGYGFPRHRGGPMHYADTIGLATILDDLRSFAREDTHFWEPAALLVRLVEQGQSFDRLNTSVTSVDSLVS